MSAARDYERWHWGRPSTRTVEVSRPGNMPASVAQVGRLVLLELADGRAVAIAAPGRETAAQAQADQVVRLNRALAEAPADDAVRQRRDLAVSVLVGLTHPDVHVVGAARPRGAGRSIFIAGPDPVRLPDGFQPGTIAAITYETAKGQRPELPYRHEFEGTRPRLSTYATGEVCIERAGSTYDMLDGGITG